MLLGPSVDASCARSVPTFGDRFDSLRRRNGTITSGGRLTLFEALSALLNVLPLGELGPNVSLPVLRLGVFETSGPVSAHFLRDIRGDGGIEGIRDELRE